MTRATILLLCALTFSATLGLADDDLQVLWENPYDFSSLAGGFASYGTYNTQDDFTLETDSVLEAVECWAFYYLGDPDPHPQPFYVNLRYDHYGMPGETTTTTACPVKPTPPIIPTMWKRPIRATITWGIPCTTTG
ncbi:MAG: hypothetical protein NTW26_04020 [bacterium]|nr:hypothetical protein [bacterium]